MMRVDHLTTKLSELERISVKANFRLAVFILLFGCIFSMALSFVGYGIKSRTFVVETSNLIPTSFTQQRISSDWSTPVLRTTIADFITKYRSIPNDAAIMTEDLNFVLSHVLKGSPAEQKVETYIAHREQGPAQLIRQYTRRVTVQSVNFIGGNTWLVEWEEVAFPKSDTKNRKTVLYQGEVEIASGDAPDLDAISRNPLGITVRNFTQNSIGQKG